MAEGVGKVFEAGAGFVRDVWNDGKAVWYKEKPELADSVVYRVIGVFAFCLGVYLAAPAVMAFLSNTPGAVPRLLTGVVLLVAGHDFTVVGRDQADRLRKGDVGQVTSMIANAAGNLASAARSLVDGKQREKVLPDDQNTWVWKYIAAPFQTYGKPVLEAAEDKLGAVMENVGHRMRKDPESVGGKKSGGKGAIDSSSSALSTEEPPKPNN